MKSKTRYVFDTNAIISGLLFKKSKPAIAFRYALKHGEILLSLELLEELNIVIRREKFNRYVTMEEREEFLDTLIDRGVLIELIVKVQAYRDPKDDQILELALSGQAEYIISGDKDLLVLNPFQELKIVTAEEFCQTINDE